MGVQEWTIILGVIFGVAILLWMAARWRKRRYDEIYSYDDSQDEDTDIEYTSELPSGGARTVGYRDPSDIERMNTEIRERADSLKPRLSSFAPASTPRQQQSLFAEEDEQGAADQKETTEEQVPLLLDPSEEHSGVQEAQAPDEAGVTPPEAPLVVSSPAEEIAEEKEDLESGMDEKISSLDGSDRSPMVDVEGLPAEKNSGSDTESEAPVFATEPDESAEVPERDVASIENHALENDRAETETTSEPESPSVEPEQPKSEKAKPAKEKSWKLRRQKEAPKPPPSEPAEIIIINLMTKPENAYNGPSLVRALNELGMRFGDMDIFHYCGKHGDGAPQFRMANLLNPGVFDMNKIDELRTHALCFFFELAPDQDNMSIYESMISVITRLKDELGGEMRDDQRSVFTIQTSEHCRHRIRDFQRRHLVRKP